MSVPLDVQPAGSGQDPVVGEPVAAGSTGATGGIQGRSLGQIAWRRLKRDKVAIGGGLFLIFLVLVAVFAPLIVKVLGDPPNEFHQDPELLDMLVGGVPRGAFGGISWDHLMGLEPQNGRDIFSRVVYGARISLLIALFATLLSVVIGVVAGTVSGSSAAGSTG